MPESLKPYDPNKGFISFRLNPEAIKEELISFVPYNRTLHYFHDNPEAPISETAKIAMSETPILGSLLAGEPVDAAKEAILFSAPIKAKTKTKVKNLGPDTRFYQDPNYDYSYGKITAYANPVNGKNGYIHQFKSNMEINRNRKNLNAQIGTPDFGMNEMLSSIDNSNAMHKLNGKNDRISYREAYDEAMNPYNKDRLYSDPNFINTPEGSILNEGIDLSGKLGELQSKEGAIRLAEKVKPKLKPGESLIQDADGKVYILKGNDVYYLLFANNRRSSRYWKYASNLTPQEIATEFTPYNPMKYEKAKKLLNNEIKVYNAKADFYDTHVPIDPNKPAMNWFGEIGNRKREFTNSVNGPFIEDLLHGRRH